MFMAGRFGIPAYQGAETGLLPDASCRHSDTCSRDRHALQLEQHQVGSSGRQLQALAGASSSCCNCTIRW